jgi:hypothetical protein
MSEIPEVTPDITIPSTLIDRIAGLMVILQRSDPVDLLQLGQLLDRLVSSYQSSFGQWIADRKIMHQLAGEILTELQQIRGPWVVCHLCKPPQKIESKLVKQHDINMHGAYRG